MKHTAWMALAIFLGIALWTSVADAGGEARSRRRAQYYPWHGRHYHTAWGTPVALVVPPTAKYQTDWGWGVGNTRLHRIDHQYWRPWPGPYGGGNGFLPTPNWPSDTTQFGVYSVRGPW